jgi:hypothetical protein
MSPGEDQKKRVVGAGFPGQEGSHLPGKNLKSTLRF